MKSGFNIAVDAATNEKKNMLMILPNSIRHRAENGGYVHDGNLYLRPARCPVCGGWDHEYFEAAEEAFAPGNWLLGISHGESEDIYMILREEDFMLVPCYEESLGDALANLMSLATAFAGENGTITVQHEFAITKLLVEKDGELTVFVTQQLTDLGLNLFTDVYFADVIPLTDVAYELEDAEDQECDCECYNCEDLEDGECCCERCCGACGDGRCPEDADYDDEEYDEEYDEDDDWEEEELDIEGFVKGFVDTLDKSDEEKEELIPILVEAIMEFVDDVEEIELCDIDFDEEDEEDEDEEN